MDCQFHFVGFLFHAVTIIELFEKMSACFKLGFAPMCYSPQNNLFFVDLNLDVLFPCPEFLGGHIRVKPGEIVTDEAVSLFTSIQGGHIDVSALL